MQYLNLDPRSSESPVLKLHDIENALSALSATLFWIGKELISLLQVCEFIFLEGHICSPTIYL
jgi:hypothetical protein